MEDTLSVSNDWLNFGLYIHKYQSPIEDSDHSQMGPTGWKSLAPALWRFHPQNGYEDEQVRHKDNQKRGNQIKSCKEPNYQFNLKCVWTEQRYQGDTITDKMIDDIVATKG